MRRGTLPLMPQGEAGYGTAAQRAHCGAPLRRREWRGAEASGLRLRLAWLVMVVVLAGAPLAAQAEAAPAGGEAGTFPGPEAPLEVYADLVRYYGEQRLVTATGNVRAVYEDLEVRSGELVADLEAQTATFRGEVALRYREQTFRGTGLYVDLRTRLWQFREVTSALTPRFFERGVIRPVYIAGEEAQGGGPRLQVREGQVTTCDLPEPHYRISSGHVTIYPGRRLVARDLYFWLGRHRVLRLPSFSVSLRERERLPVVPEVGQNEIDGRYLRTRYQYSLADSAPGAVRVDVMERRGLGTGIEQSYGQGGVAGSLLLYRASSRGQNELQGRLRHEQDLGGGMSLAAFGDYRQNAGYYLPGTTLVDTQVALARAVGTTNSRLALSFHRNQGFTDFSSLLGTLEHTQSLGTRQTLLASSSYQSYDVAPGQPDDVEVNNRVTLVDRHRPFDLTLEVAKRLDPDNYEGDDFYQTLDRLPQVTVESTSYRLPALGLLGVPARASMSLGEFFERPTDLRAARYALAWDSLPVTQRLGGHTSAGGQAGLRQTFYGDADHTAQYAYHGTLNLFQQLSRHWSLRSSYYLLKPKGYTPFRFDYLGSYEQATAGLAFDNGRAGRASLLTGFDFENGTWRNLQGRLNTRLGRTVTLALASAYNLNRGESQDLAALGTLVEARTAWRLGLRYDPRSSRWRRITSELDWLATDKWRIQSIAGWDGGQRRFIYNELLVVRDLHCWEALVYYSHSRRLFRLDLRIKAFDWGRRDFGVARSGQLISPVPPEVY